MTIPDPFEQPEQWLCTLGINYYGLWQEQQDWVREYGWVLRQCPKLPERVLDLGTGLGLSALVWLTGGAEEVLTVDHDPLRHCGMTRLAQGPWCSKVRFLVGRSVEALKDTRIGSFGLVFLDTSHEYEDVRRELALCWDRTASGGVMAGHDLCDPQWPGVRRALDEFCGQLRLRYNEWSAKAGATGVFAVRKER